MTIDTVLSYHMNTFACGVSRFNHQLAKRLGVPCQNLTGYWAQAPLISIKTSEMPAGWTHYCPQSGPFDLLFHDRPTDGAETIARARRVFFADEIGIPSTIEGNAHRGLLNVLLFGMSSKVERNIDYLERLRDLLVRAHADYTVSVSTAVHEGSPWDGAFTTTVDRLRDVFTDHLRVLGYLADDALARELHTCHAVALFFEPAARANNTTLWAALGAGVPVVTNLDSQSPPELIHNKTVFDIARMESWPFGHVRADAAHAGKIAAAGRSWEKLIERLHG